MELTVAVSGAGPIPSTALYQCTLTVAFDGPIETMTMTVIIPRTDDEAALKAQAIARAKELARLFYETQPG